MEKYIIDDIEQAQEFLDWLGEEKPTKDIYDNKILIGNEEFELVGKAHELVFGALLAEERGDISQLPTYCELKEIEVVSDEDRIADSYTNEEIIQRIEKVKATPKEELPLVSQNKYDNNLIYGKNNTENIVSIDVKDGIVYLFKNDGSVENVPYEYWLLTHRPTKISEPLDGDLFYNYKSTYTDEEIYKKSRGVMYGRKTDFYNIYDSVESVMVSQGYTFFKGLKVSDVSVLSFDIESKGLIDDETSIPYAKNTAKVFMITNTFRDTNGKITRKMFSVDEFEDDDVAMIEAWTKWVQEIDPSIITGHNIFGYDFPYLSYCYGLRNGTKRQLELGRDCSEIVYSQKHSKFRKDGSQSYQYKNIDIFGRQIVDTFFLSIKFDFSRKYPSYGLKAIIEYEGLVKKDRQFYDAANIWKNWSIQEERDKIKAYGKDDADDAIALYDLMIPQFFYYTQSIPMTLQAINNTATGRQINLFLVRSYLQEGHSIPKTTEKKQYGGGISFGNPGLYSNVFKIDLKAMYPSIMLQYKVYDKDKDPKANFLEMLKFFYGVRDEYKLQLKETGDKHFKDMEQSTKIVQNSAYGLLGATGLNFNSSDLADFVTTTARNIIKFTIKWATGEDYEGKL